MPSSSYNEWRGSRASAINEMHQRHAAVGGTARGRRYATQQINRALARTVVLTLPGILSRPAFRMCRPHSRGGRARRELVQFGASRIYARSATGQRQCSAEQPGADFGRLGLDFWDEVVAFNSSASSWKSDLDLLNEWRNAIAHQDFTSPKLDGIINLRVTRVRAWRVSCGRLAQVMDEVLRLHLQGLTGASPW